MIKRLITLTIFLIVSSTLIFSQVGQTGTIRGTVTDMDGNPLPGVLVTINSKVLVLEKMTTVTNTNGHYRFHSLPPGDYEIIFSLEGLNTMVRKGIRVAANVNTTINMSMQLKTLEEQILVEAKGPTIDKLSTTKNVSLDAEFLKSIPTANLTLNNFMNMTPGVNAGTTQTGSVRDNTWNLDGINTTDPCVGSMGATISTEILDEISVQTGSISAEHTGGSGVIVNAVTKSGGNKLNGALTFYMNHENWQSDNTTGTPLEGSVSGFEYEIVPGLSLGGPLVKDKLWFFGHVNMRKSNQYFPGFPWDKETDTGRPIREYIPYVKLTYQPSQNDKFIASFNYDIMDRDFDVPSRYDTEDSTRDFQRRQSALTFHWIHNFSSNFYTSLRVGWAQLNFGRYARVQDTWYWEWTNGRTSNGGAWDDAYKRPRIQVNLDGTLFVDNLAGFHELKFGAQYSVGSSHRIAQVYGDVDPAGLNNGWSYSDNGVVYMEEWWWGPDRTDAVSSIDLFVNDTWNVTKNLTINLGLRAEFSTNYFPPHTTGHNILPPGNLAVIGRPDIAWDMTLDTKLVNWEWQTLSPRVGMVFDVFKDASTLLKANYAVYMGSNLSDLSYFQHPVNWVGYIIYVDAGGNMTGIDWIQTPTDPTKVGYPGHELLSPKTQEISVAIERELFEDWSIIARYVNRKTTRLMEDADASQLDMDKLMNNGELDWSKNWTLVTATDPYDGSTISFYNRNKWVDTDLYFVNPPGLEKKYSGFEITLKKRYANGWQLSMSYVLNNAKGLVGTDFWASGGDSGLYENPNLHINAYGHLNYERYHEFKLQGLVKGPLGINVSGNFRYLKGYPYTRQVRSADIGVNLNSRQTVFAEARGSSNLPDFIQLDLRLEKAFKFGESVQLSLFCDIFNVFNANAATAVYSISSNPGIPFAEMEDIQDPRIFRLGARLEF